MFQGWVFENSGVLFVSDSPDLLQAVAEFNARQIRFGKPCSETLRVDIFGAQL